MAEEIENEKEEMSREEGAEGGTQNSELKTGEEEEDKRPRRKKKEKKAVKKRKSRKEKEKPLARAVRMAVETGKVEFGAKTGVKDSLLAKAKVIVIASNAPKELQEDIFHFSRLSNMPVLVFDGTSMELGSICGKPYSVSVLSVYDGGSSDILELAKQKK